MGRIGLLQAADDPNARVAWFVLIGTVPAAVAGFFLESRLERDLRSPWIVASMFIAVGLVFLLAEGLGKRNRTEHDLTLFDSLVIGLRQAIALIPGVSRSGITISAGLLRNLERPAAATFAFLLAEREIADHGKKPHHGRNEEPDEEKGSISVGAKQMVDVVREFQRDTGR